MIIHTIFIIFFYENKIRLTSKFRSEKWKNQIMGELFDGILYLKEMDKEEECPSGYEEYKNGEIWPGTERGVFFYRQLYNYPCEFIINTDININNILEIQKDYKLVSVFSPFFGSMTTYKKYKINAPYNEKCNEKDKKCECQAFLDTFENFQKLYPELVQKSKVIKGEKIFRKFSVIEEKKPISLLESVLNNTKLCKKKVNDYYILFNEKKCENDGVICGEDKICIRGETECPNYLNLSFFNILDISKESKKLEEKLISSIDFIYNDIPCSILDKNIHYSYNKLPIESNFKLSNFNKTYLDDVVGLQRCSSKNLNGKEEKEEEDIIRLAKIPIRTFYKKGQISKELDQIDYERNYVDKSEDNIYLTVTTYFEPDIKNKCPEDSLDIIYKTVNLARKISPIKYLNTFWLDFLFIMALCGICYCHFTLLNKRTEPSEKFYFVKFYIFWTIIFFTINIYFFQTNKELENSLGTLLNKLDNINNSQCFISKDYTNYLKEIKNRLGDFGLLNYQIYLYILIENIIVVSLFLFITLSKVPFKIFCRFKNKE